MRSLLVCSVGAASLVAVGALACALLPERYAINAPVLNMMFGWFGAGTPAQDLFGARIRVPDGFSVGVYAAAVPGVRFLRPLPGGALLATTPREGKVWLLAPDRDGDRRSDSSRALLEGLERPHGLDLYDGWLYVAEGSGVGRVRIDSQTGELARGYERVVNDLPQGGNHWSRTVRFGPDGWMYVSVGSSCNACIETDERRAAMLRFRPDGSDAQIFATGLRNSAGFDWQPGTGALYATDNGRDLLGDDFPPCELNLVRRDGFYGWPFANGDRVPDPDLGEKRPERVRRVARRGAGGVARLVEPHLEERIQGRLAALGWRREDRRARFPGRVRRRGRGRHRAPGRRRRSGRRHDLRVR
jgi:glucose/arabinose dehydrogenase